jgi:hypothetical protein
MSRKRLVICLGFGIAALCFALVALVGPADVDRAAFAWSAADDPLDVPLVLSATRPQSIDVDLPCELARSDAGPTQLFNSSSIGRGLTVVGTGTDVVVRVSRDVASLPIPAADPCTANVHFGIGDGRLRLSVGTKRTEVHLERDAQPIVTGIHAHPDTAGSALSARIVTQPVGSSPSRRQLGAIAGAVTCALVAGWLLVRATRRGTFPSWRRTPVLTISDGVVAVTALASTVITPATFDDGWVLATVRGFASSGRFSTYYERDGALLIQGGWWDTLTYPLLSSVNNVVVLRLLFVACAVLAWWVVRRWVIDQWSQGAGRRHARFAGAAMAVLVLPAWLTTLRPEPLIALLAAVAMAAVLRFSQRPSVASLLTMLLVGALAMTNHQTGWVVVTATLPAVLFLVPWLREAPRFERLLALTTAVLVAAAIAVLLAGWDTDLALLRRAAVDTTAQGEGYSYGPFDEWIRPHDTIVYESAVRRAAMLLPLLGLIAAAVTAPRRKRDLQRLAVWCSVTGYLGLALTSSKLVWHYGAVMPFSIVLVAAGFQRLLADESHWPELKRVLAAACVAVVGAFALSTQSDWNEFDLSSEQWGLLPYIESLGDLNVSRPIVWLLGLAVGTAALFGLRAWKHRPADVSRGVLALALGAACVVPVGLTWSVLADDARSTDGWSFTDQLISSATGGDVCGLGEDLGVVASAVPLASTSEPEDLPRALPGAYVQTASNATLPVAGVDTWGTGATPPGRRGPAPATGRFATPWYALDGATDLAFWTVGVARDPNGITVEARDSEGDVVAADPARSTGAPFWSINRITSLPRSATEVRLVLEDNDPAPRGWLAATAPARVSYEPFASSLSSQDRVWVAPQHHFYAPCVDLPSTGGGYLEPFDAIIVAPPIRGIALRLMSEGSIVQTGCIDAGPAGPGGPKPGPCAYRVEAADAASLLVP